MFFLLFLYLNKRQYDWIVILKSKESIDFAKSETQPCLVFLETSKYHFCSKRVKYKALRGFSKWEKSSHIAAVKKNAPKRAFFERKKSFLFLKKRGIAFFEKKKITFSKNDAIPIQLFFFFKFFYSFFSIWSQYSIRFF